MGTDFSFTLVRPGRRTSTFESKLLHADSERIVLTHVIHPSKPYTFEAREVVGDGYRAIWFLVKDRPYDIGRFYRPDGTWTGYYVDILDPVRWEESDPATLRPLVDLFLDLWIEPDGRFAVLDEDEFAEAVTDGVLSPSQASCARAALDHLVRLTQHGGFPPGYVREFDCTEYTF